MNHSLEQQRASAAMQAIEGYHAKLQAQSGDDTIAPSSEYLSAIKALPAAVLQSGLGQSLASYQAASTKGPKLVYQHLQTWLCSEHSFTPYPANEPLLKALMAHDQGQYLLAQAETLAYSRWLKKLAVAEFPDEKPTVPVKE